MTDQQRAAHMMLPVVAELVKELQAEYRAVLKEAQQPKKNHDAMDDWREFAARAEGRVQGAQRVAGLLQVVARG